MTEILNAKNISKSLSRWQKYHDRAKRLKHHRQSWRKNRHCWHKWLWQKYAFAYFGGGLTCRPKAKFGYSGKLINQLNETERGNLRNQHLGFIYQFHHLLAEFTAIENVAMPLLMRNDVPINTARDEAIDLLKKVGLEHRLTHRPGELSGGERQRVAIARALVTKPSLVLADEPTGNLDYANAQAVFEILTQLQNDFSTALLMVTHDRQLAQMADKQLAMQNGSWATM